jgi:hypothetical protein
MVDPDTKLLVLTPPQLQREDLRVLLEFPVLIRSLFKSTRVTVGTLALKNVFTSKTSTGYLPNLPSSRELRTNGCTLSRLKRSGLLTPTPPCLHNVAWSLRFSKTDRVLLQLSSSAQK